MSIILTKSAVDKLLANPELRRWRDEAFGCRVPCLRYFRRCYSTSRDGTVTEYGDGFTLTTIDPVDTVETEGIVLKSVAVADGLDIVVAGEESMMSGGFIVGWLKWKFTYEP